MVNDFALHQLGTKSAYFDEYNPHLLEKVSRAPSRASFRIATNHGFDIWRLYEITYLNRFSIPEVAMGIITIPATSPFIVESKSLKLYLGSFTQTKFENLDEVAQVITHDLATLLESDLKVDLYPVEEASEIFAVKKIPGTLIDLSSGFVVDSLKVNPNLLVRHEGPRVEERLRSNILRTLCPVTSQPDHASVFIRYQGMQINHLDLLRYLISYRTHQGFHEQCTEMIYHDLKLKLKLDKLEVICMFTRRGGIDINPIRSDFAYDASEVIRHLRQ